MTVVAVVGIVEMRISNQPTVLSENWPEEPIFDKLKALSRRVVQPLGVHACGLILINFGECTFRIRLD